MFCAKTLSNARSIVILSVDRTKDGYGGAYRFMKFLQLGMCDQGLIASGYNATFNGVLHIALGPSKKKKSSSQKS
jgi:hypothetical protein